LGRFISPKPRKVAKAEPPPPPPGPLSAQLKEKIARAPKVVFLDERGVEVPPQERYQRARSMYEVLKKPRREVDREGRVTAYRKGDLYPLIGDNGRLITPNRIATVMGGRQRARELFEAIPPNFSEVTRYRPADVKATAWNVAGKIDRTWGLRGKKLWVTMNVLDGKRLIRLRFAHHMRGRGPMQASLWMHMNEVMQGRHLFLYDRIGNRRIKNADGSWRSGRHVRLHSVDMQIEM